MALACSSGVAQPPSVAKVEQENAFCPREWRWDGPRNGDAPLTDLDVAPLPSTAGGGVYQIGRLGVGTRCGRWHCKRRICSRKCETAAERSALSFTDGNGRAVWKTDLPIDRDDATLLLADEERVYLVSFQRVAMGATVMAFDGTTGRPLYGLGVGRMTCAHSSYSNRLRVELSRERLLVWGWEAMGRYVTAIEPRSGRVLCERLFDEIERCW